MPLVVSQIAPYLSFVLAQARPGIALTGLADHVLTRCLVVVGVEAGSRRDLVERTPEAAAGGLRAAMAHYCETRRPSWSLVQSIADELHHIIVVCRYKRLVAIHLSDASLKATVVNHLRKDPVDGSLNEYLNVVPEGRLNAAFVSGETRTLWLGGTHRRSRVKADNKILSGIDLRDSLDPAADQSYYFSAARSRINGAVEDTTVGVAPAKSTMWISATKSWQEFSTVTKSVLEQLSAAVASNDAPLPVLATPVHDATTVRDAFDFVLEPPEGFIEGDDDLAARQEWERWAYNTIFEVTGDPNGLNLTAAVSRGDVQVCYISVSLDASRPDRVKFEATTQNVADGMEDSAAELVEKINSHSWVKVHYESGHTVAQRRIFSMRRRTTSFASWNWETFPAMVNITKEKPTNLATTGSQNGDSLFDWVARDWALTQDGWLACDDGAGEIADFIHLNDAVQPPVLSLIHVKGAKSTAAGRLTSVSRYEVVSAQAVKNLRFLDRVIGVDGLAAGAGRAVAELVWKDRARCPRQDMIDALVAIGDSHTRRVVIVQPHQQRSRFENLAGADVARVPLLSDLLLSTEASCRGVSSEFAVVGHDQ